MNEGSCWRNGSYFRPDNLNENHISCVHDAALDGTNDGGWLYPDGDPCTSTTSPIQCTNVATDGPTNITLQRVAFFADMEFVYKCCLPNDCDNGPTDIIIANIYSRLYLIKLLLMSHTLGNIYIIENTFDPPSDITAIPQSYTVHCVIAGGELNKGFHYYYKDSSDIDLNSTYCSSQTGYDCSLTTDNTVTSEMTPNNVIDKTISITWEAEEISSGAFKQNNQNGDHVIECNARRGSTTRESTVTIGGIIILSNYGFKKITAWYTCTIGCVCCSLFGTACIYMEGCMHVENSNLLNGLTLRGCLCGISLNLIAFHN